MTKSDAINIKNNALQFNYFPNEPENNWIPFGNTADRIFYKPTLVKYPYLAQDDYLLKLDDKEQIELGRFVDKITTIGAKVVLSNSDPKNADKNDCFFDELYSSYSIQRVSAKRMINSNAKNRGSINELLIWNY